MTTNKNRLYMRDYEKRPGVIEKRKQQKIMREKEKSDKFDEARVNV